MIPHRNKLLLGLCCLCLCGCGAQAGAAPKATAVKHAFVPTAARPTAPPVVQTQAPPTSTPPTLAASPTASAAPSPSATRAPRPVATLRPVAQVPPPALVSASLLPLSVSPGGSLQATVLTRGAVGRVELYIGSGSPSGPAPVTYLLPPTGSGAWGRSLPAPSVPGTYHFTFGLYNRSGTRFLQDRDSWNLTVVGAQPTVPVGQPLPDDIPLAPPFSYGNPVSASFTAEGRAVNGSEVVGSTAAQVDPSALVQFYVNHLPRAGWTVDQSTVPAAGASSFTLAATKPAAGGTEVCLVEYTAPAIHIFYGTTAG